MVKQLKLFESVIKEDKEATEVKIDKRSFAAETLVYLYKIEDKKDNLLYFGITDNYEKRIGDHKAGKHDNKDSNAAYKDHPEQFEYSLVCSFIDPEYCSKGNKSRSHAIEAFAMAFYDSLNKKHGFNRSYKFHHDFKDKEFWMNILPPELLPLYLNANHSKLNKNVYSYIKRSKKKSGSTHEILAKTLIREQLLIFKNRDLKLGKYAEEFESISRSNLHRFLNEEYEYLSVERSLNLIKRIEEYLDIKNRFDFESKYMDALRMRHIIK